MKGVESTLGICGGDPCIVQTRIPVWLREKFRRLGVSESDLLATYPTLRAEDLANVCGYAQRSLRRESVASSSHFPAISSRVMPVPESCYFVPETDLGDRIWDDGNNLWASPNA